MALLLNIDTALSEATLSIADGTEILAEQKNNEQKSHAGFVQSGIKSMLEALKLSGKQLDAIAVSAGPGSYTGLRVGLASAKGLCYGWKKPLILLNTLEVLAQNALLECPEKVTYYCPMIDARRMEVFAAVYNEQLEPILPPGAYLLENPDFLSQLRSNQAQILFFGNGMSKWREISAEKTDKFLDLSASNIKAMNLLSQKAFSGKSFADVAYSEPFYFKSFYTTAKVIT